MLASDLPTALREMEAIAAQSRSGGNFMYQANINPQGDERLTPAQWKEATDTLENHLGLSGHQRVVVEHEKEGRAHRHVIWNRVDVDNLRVTDIGGDYYAHERAARTIELKFDLQRTASLHGERRPEGRPERPAELWQQRAAERSGIDPQQIKADLTELWRKTDSGKAFAAAIEERGYILAQGDRRSFCIVDQAGDAHSLARRIEGVKVKDIRERLDGISPVNLPTVDEARTAQRERHPTQEAAREAWEGRTGAAAPQPPEREQTAPQEPQRPSPHVPRQEEAPRQPEATPRPQERPAEPWHSRAATHIEARIFHVQEAAERGGVQVAAGLQNEGITLARVDADGKATAQRDYQQRYDAAQGAGYDEARLRQAAFKEGELVAVTRSGEIHRLNPQYLDLSRLEQAACAKQPAPALSATLEFYATERGAQKAEKEQARAEFSEERQQRREFREAARETTAQAKATQRDQREAVQEIKGAGLTVADTATGAVCSLSSFAEGLLNLMGGSPPPLSEGDMIVRERRAAAAIESLSESLERGDRLNASDLQNLTPTHLENLAMRGDAYMRELVEAIQRGGITHEYDYSRSREI